LNEFSFEENNEEKVLFNEELYEEVINKKDIRFTEDDIEKINNLIQVEISQNLLDMLAEYEEQERNKPKPKTQQQVLEDILTTYAVERNLTFTKADIDAINKLMSVELDMDFVTDLRTNPERVKTVQKELKNPSAKHHQKPSEIMTLNVKDLLPDLSNELKKQGKKKIESNNKPEVVYYSEGYEVSKLEVSNDLADISTQLKSKKDNAFKPSYTSPVVEDGYTVSTLEIGKGVLPDLEDVKAHPKKYEDKPEPKKKADEKILLERLSNVTFKPFYDGIDTEEKHESHEVMTYQGIPLYQEPSEIEDFSESQEDSVHQAPQAYQEYHNDKREDDAKKLLELIEAQQAERAAKKQNLEERLQFKKELEQAAKKEQKSKKPQRIQFNESGQILSEAEINSQAKCQLIKSGEEYIVIGNINGNQVELKRYETLKNTNIQSRVHAKNQFGEVQYLIRLGQHKFVISVSKDNMEFVMDLC